MPEETLPIIPAEKIDSTQIEDIKNLPQLLNYLSNHLAANAGPILSLLNNFPLEVTGSEGSSNNCGTPKVQLVTGTPCYIHYDGCRIYPYPPNVPLLYIGDDKPTYLTELSVEEKANLNLVEPDSAANAKWVIFKTNKP